MAKPHFKLIITAEQHAEVERLFRQTNDVKERARLQAVLLGTRGDIGWRDLAPMVGCAVSTLQQWVAKYLKGGVAELLDRKKAPGKKSRLQEPEVQAQLKEGLQKGTWRTGRQVRRWLAKAHGIQLAQRSIYYWLGKAQGVLRVPRPVPIKRDPAAVSAFRENLVAKLTELNLPKDRAVKVWVMDEARFGLHSQTRRCWGLRGVPVVVPRQHCYQWDYLYGALEVMEGGSCFSFLPTVGLELTSLFLEQIAATDGQAEHVVLYDQAGFHLRPGDPRLPARVHLVLLPPYSPELNPVEGVWDYGRDGMCNQVFQTLDQMQNAVSEQLRPLWEEPARALSLVHHWLQAQVNSLSNPVCADNH